MVANDVREHDVAVPPELVENRRVLNVPVLLELLAHVLQRLRRRNFVDVVPLGRNTVTGKKEGITRRRKEKKMKR